jgi:hypothetical protein
MDKTDSSVPPRLRRELPGQLGTCSRRVGLSCIAELSRFSQQVEHVLRVPFS